MFHVSITEAITMSTMHRPHHGTTERCSRTLYHTSECFSPDFLRCGRNLSAQLKITCASRTVRTRYSCRLMHHVHELNGPVHEASSPSVFYYPLSHNLFSSDISALQTSHNGGDISPPNSDVSRLSPTLDSHVKFDFP